MIDELQYVPELFSCIKMEIDKGASPELTGSPPRKRLSLWSLHRSRLPDVFYSSYLQTYIDRDVKEQVQLADPLLFCGTKQAVAE